METPNVDPTVLLAAYQEYDLRPTQGVFYNQELHCACALTVWWMHTHQGSLPWNEGQEFIVWREWPEAFVDGFIDGFDQRSYKPGQLDELFESDEYGNGYTQGDRARQALGLDIMAQQGRPR